MPLRELLLNSDTPDYKVTTLVAFEEDKLNRRLADVNVSVKLKNPLSAAKDWMKEKLSLSQSVLQT